MRSGYRVKTANVTSCAEERHFDVQRFITNQPTKVDRVGKPQGWVFLFCIGVVVVRPCSSPATVDRGGGGRGLRSEIFFSHQADIN